jgi:flagella basal body P-ring formation protein FlgA
MTTFWKLSRVSAAGLTAWAAGGAHAADFVLRDTARPAGAIVRLADVAQVLCDDKAEAERLGAMPLMPTPAPGETTHLRASALRELLAAQGESIARHRFAGAIATRVEGETASQDFRLEARPASWRAKNNDPVASSPAPQTGFRLPRSAPQAASLPPARVPAVSRYDRTKAGKRVQAAIETWLKATPGAEALAVENVELDTAAADTVARWGDIAIGAESVDGLPDAGDTQSLRFTLRPGPADVDGSVEARALVVRVPVGVVAKAPIARGELITASMISIEPAPLKQRDRFAGVYEAMELALGKEAAASIPKGAPLSDKNCASPILVRRGEPVTVVTGGGGIRVRMEVVAQADGRGGDLVPVEHAERRERFDARVIGPRMLAVLDGGGGAADGSAPLGSPPSPYSNFSGTGASR